jgi:hypothetical protein
VGELGGCSSSLRPRGALDPRDVLRLHALSALGFLVGHLVALIEELESFARYATVVDEEVLAPVVRPDEAVAFLVVEPLDRSLGLLASTLAKELSEG